jgi:hypothetical protein
VKGVLVSIFGQDPQVIQFAESLRFQPKLGQSNLFGPVEETSRDSSCLINDAVHGAAARGTIDSSIAKRFVFPTSRTIASIAARRLANRAAAGDLPSKEYRCFRDCPIHLAFGTIPVCRKSRMHLKTRGFPVLIAAVI